jgi:FkbM family methyltransferase
MNKIKHKLFDITIKIINTLYPFPGPYFAFFNPGFLHIKQAISLIKQLKPDKNNIIIDVGASEGSVSLFFAKHFPQTKIYSFEPIQSSYKRLVSATKQFSNIHPINKAAGAAKYSQEINVANRISSSSLFELNPKNDDNFITKNIGLVNKEKIEVSTIDDEIPNDVNINLIKFDVQGFEIEAMKGAIDALKRTLIVVVEVSNHNYYLNGAKYYEIDDFLRSKDFELLSFIPSLRDKNKILEWDAIYSNKKLV